MSSAVPSCRSGPGEETSALSGSLVPGHFMVKSLPQGSLALALSRYFWATRSSIPRGQLPGLSIMYLTTACWTDCTRVLAIFTWAFLNWLKIAVPTPPAMSAMIASTIMISMRVNPASAVRAIRPRFLLLLSCDWIIGLSSLDEVLHVENGLQD